MRITTFVACGALTLLWFGANNVVAQIMGGVHVIEPGPTDRRAPFRVGVTRVQIPGQEVLRIAVSGSRRAGTQIAPVLELRQGDRFLSTPLMISETKVRVPEGTFTWTLRVTVDAQTANDCSIEMYIQPEGVPYDGGTRYRIPLGPWAAKPTNQEK